MRPKGRARGLGWTLAVLAVLVAPWVLAESSFFRVSPGPLSESHAELDNSEACSKCHEANKGVTNAKCLDCHKTLRDRIGRKQGLHATFSGNCIRCHPGHKGRTTSIVDWNHVGGQQNFRHELTGFPLTNYHGQVACTACHTKRLKSGRISYLGLTPDCAGCHRDVHKLTQPELAKKCEQCHGAGKVNRGMRLDAWERQHQEVSRVTFTGKHLQQPCTKCHAKAEFAARTPPRGCVDCHRPKHPAKGEAANCVACHKAGEPWKSATIDHRRFGFPLLGKHQTVPCQRCHPGGAVVDYAAGACTSCHQHREVHKRQFADKSCLSCHVEGGKRTRPFDHNQDTRFRLLGFHAKPALRAKCVACHPQAIYRTNKLGCADCHKDKHKGQSGPDCTRCHSVTQKWKDARYAKPHLKFPLEGLHRQAKCEGCHPGSKYKLGDVRCVDCHRKSDPHKGKLGDACEKCHTPAKGAPKFKHETMTRFARAGAHLGVPCTFCHRAPPAAPPEVGWTRRATASQLDRQFPLMGKACADCHADPHKGSAGKECQQCHELTSFRALSGEARAMRPGDHDRGWLRRHTNLPFEDDDLNAEGRACARCHGSPTCDRCHRTAAPKSHTALWRLRAHGTAAAFDPDSCRVCHVTGTCVQCHKTTAPLNHRGAWGTLHGYAAGTLADSNCYTCHSRAECRECHATK